MFGPIGSGAIGANYLDLREQSDASLVISADLALSRTLASDETGNIIIEGSTSTFAVVDYATTGTLSIDAATAAQSIVDYTSTSNWFTFGDTAEYTIIIESSTGALLVSADTAVEAIVDYASSGEWFTFGDTTENSIAIENSSGTLLLSAESVIVSVSDFVSNATVDINTSSTNIIKLEPTSSPELSLAGTVASPTTLLEYSDFATELSAESVIVSVSDFASQGELEITAITEGGVVQKEKGEFLSEIPLTLSGSTDPLAVMLEDSAGELEISASTSSLMIEDTTTDIGIDLDSSTTTSAQLIEYSNSSVELSADTSMLASMLEPSSIPISIASTTITSARVLEDSDITLSLDGSILFSVGKAEASAGELEISANTGFRRTFATRSNGYILISSYMVASAILIENTDPDDLGNIHYKYLFNSSGVLDLQSTTDFYTSVNQNVELDSQGTLILSASTVVTPALISNTHLVDSTGSMTLNGQTVVSTRIFTNISVDSRVELELLVSNAYMLPAVQKPHSGGKSLKTKRRVTESKSRQIAFLSHVRYGMRIASKMEFVPAPPIVETPAEPIIPPKRPLGELGRFLEKFDKKRLNYSYDSTTETASFSVSSDVEVGNHILKSRALEQQIDSEDALLLGLNEESLLMDSARSWDLWDITQENAKNRSRREQEDLDLLGIND